MSLIFWNPFNLLEELVKIVDRGIRHPILEIKVGSACCWHRNLISFLVFVNHVPEGIGTILFFETDCHNFTFFYLHPFNTISI